MKTRLHRWIAPTAGVFSAAFSLGLILPASAPAQTVSPSTTDSDETILLSTFTVSGEQSTGYESMQTTSGMRTVQELKNVANSISIVNSQLITDLAAITIEDMTQWTVTGEANPDPTVVSGSSRLIFRGIQNNYAIRNGWIWYSPIDAYSTDRLELLRGPNAFLYGEADLGGAQNQITKRGLFTKNFSRVKLIAGSNDLYRGELDINRRLNDQLAVRVAAVKSVNKTWWDHGERDFRGIYGAVTYRPFRNTTVTVMGEVANSTEVRSQGLFADNFSYTTTTTLANAAGVAYLPVNGSNYRLTGRLVSRGPGATVVDPLIVPREAQFNGPNATNKSDQKSLSFEVEHNIGRNLHLLLSGNYYTTDTSIMAASSRVISRDLNPTLPNGAANPYYNELYTEYYRTRQVGGNVVRDIRLSAVYDLELSWMKQQIVVNASQHQDNPGQKYPKMGEYVIPGTSAFVGTVRTDLTQAGFVANRATFTNNRFMRRYYLKDGDGGKITGSVDPVAGLSDYFPDFSGTVVPAGGALIDRRFYTPSLGVGAAGSYFKNHLFTLVGVRRDEFNMKSTVGAPRPQANTWIVDEIPGGFSNPQYVNYRFTGSNYGGVVRINDMLAFSFNQAKSFRLSLGDGGNGYLLNTKQGIPYGEGQDIGMRLSLFDERLEFNTTYYENYQPNGRITPLTNAQQNVRDELSAIFPTTFDPSGTDLQKLTTSGVEIEMVANMTKSWRIMLNLATNEMVTEDRLVQLKDFQAQAKALNRPTPLLDALLATFPEGVPTAGYTKTRMNIFTRYDFKQGTLKGFYVGGGANWRGQTFRGNADLNQDGIAEELWSPSYALVSLLAGYQTKILNRPTTFSVNVNNLLDKDYYRSAATGSGSWGDPRSFRFTMTTEF